jgi:outer membrane protein insertion porin family
MLNKKNFITIYLLSFLFLFNFNSYAKIVENVIVNGNSRVSDQTILIYGKIDIKQNLDEEKINDILNKK